MRPSARDDAWSPPRNRGAGAYSARGRDPRNPRMQGMAGARMGRTNGRGGMVDEKPATSTGKMVGIILVFILVGVLLGAGAGYGYWKFSAPKPAAASNPPTLTSPAASPVTSPAASPTVAAAP